MLRINDFLCTCWYRTPRPLVLEVNVLCVNACRVLFILLRPNETEREQKLAS